MQEVVCGDKKVVTTLLRLRSGMHAFGYWCTFFILFIRQLQRKWVAALPVFCNIFSLFPFNESSYRTLPDEFTCRKIASLTRSNFFVEVMFMLIGVKVTFNL
ncbi:hypothetical protein A4D02_12990 [Niastella koreensis]|uniref:Uncharacterized protein n=1 Tax=Niastella koreensis TaxID=354356 RepID=A0ABX3NPV6_9BACT|nr:hypothetical protein A4D02_12990 [Niastella koreensis]